MLVNLNTSTKRGGTATIYIDRTTNGLIKELIEIQNQIKELTVVDPETKVIYAVNLLDMAKLNAKNVALQTRIKRNLRDLDSQFFQTRDTLDLEISHNRLIQFKGSSRRLVARLVFDLEKYRNSKGVGDWYEHNRGDVLGQPKQLARTFEVEYVRKGVLKRGVTKDLAKAYSVKSDKSNRKAARINVTVTGHKKEAIMTWRKSREGVWGWHWVDGLAEDKYKDLL